MFNCPKCNYKIKKSAFQDFTGYKSYKCSNKDCLEIWDEEDLLKENKYVFHVANPDIPGEVIAQHDKNSCLVEFKEPVSFSGNPVRGKKEQWICSKNLLYNSPAEAKKHSKI